MKTILLATGNQDKANEIKALLDNHYEVLTMKDLGIDIEIIEDGKTYEENALIKVRALKPFLNGKEYIIMGDDSGLGVDALDGAPGIYSARFAGENVTYADNNKKLLKLLENVPKEKRTAQFICAIALILPNGEEVVFKGCVLGEIASEEIGRDGFGYDPLFIHKETGKSYGEMNKEEKNILSHRAMAVTQVKEFLLDQSLLTK
ncbi:MAG: RdgB/HAM1 family non-canonical purine NTP pyrophosphatase [Eubacteriaceae bacterium]